MRKSGGAVTHMRQNSISQEKSNVLNTVTYLAGSMEILNHMGTVPTKKPFDEEIINFFE